MAPNQEISLKDLTVKYSGFDETVLKGISLTTFSNRKIGIIGNSHSGKTTLLHILSGIIPNIIPGDITGEVSINGLSPINDWANYNEKTGVVLQDSASQLSGLADTVFDEIAFGLVNQGIDEETTRQKVMQVADELDLIKVLGHAPSDLSGGQMQRLAIAGAMAIEPQILIMDDPTSQMDPAGRQKFFNWLGKINNITLFIYSNEIDDLAQLCDEIWVLQEGKILLNGNPHEVFNKLPEKAELDYPTSFKIAKKMNWKLKNGDYPVTPDELREAYTDAD